MRDRRAPGAWVLGILLLASGVAGADDAPRPTPLSQETPREKAAPPESPHTGFKALFRDTGGDFKHTFTDLRPLMWLGAGAAGAALVHPLDDNVVEHFEQGGSPSFWRLGKFLGLGYVQIGGAVATWGVGRIIDKRGRAAHIGLDLLRAQIVTQSLTYGIKAAARRDRPDGSGFGFPSGHASTTFASASVLQSHFGWRFGVPAYAFATYVASSRLIDNRHYLSDVVFGAAIGMAAGRSVTRHGRHHFALTPLAVPDGYGIGLTRLAN